MSETVNSGPNLYPVLHDRYGDLEEMAAAVRNAAVEYIPLERASRFDGELMQVDLDHVTLQASVGAPPHMTRAAVLPGIQTFVMLRGGGPCTLNGHTVRDTEMLHYRPGAEHFAHVARPVSLALVSIPEERFARRWATITGEPQPALAESCTLLRPATEIRRLLSDLVERALKVAALSPDAFACPEARRALAEELETTLIVAAHEARQVPRRGSGADSYGRIVSRADDVLRARLKEPVYVAELCHELEIPERTLRRAFERTFAISPIRYLKMRRLGLVHRALREADPARTLVSDLAARHGFWELGRFAGEYRRLFGEKPSETLRRRQSQASPEPQPVS
ncbi:MAG: helix-turn-helix domain-containing protein [Candidatus Eisenbacteria bacterium]